ncbi:MAG TPA: tRNA (guanosine(37)-N1)-methyltransferase TrmD [Candidatus Acutalibacter stercorigallinarum]|nr:tRNA (guanosine(37)-N1)-methyltransferase TrmD [Candidatus Acutalibacter stercorigallinarum]
MRIDILTLFPEMLAPALDHSIIGRARKKGLLQVCCHQLRDFAQDRGGRVDDTVFGGGKGMLLAAEPLARGIDAVAEHLGFLPHILYMSPRGPVLTQEKARRLAELPGLLLLCGHYEGVDQRLLDEYQAEEISIGDYVLTGGELPAAILTDAVSRMLPGVLSDQACFTEESHFSGLLEYPQYTRPEVWRGRPVPPVLLSGHHGNIAKWRREESLSVTKKNRPDLYACWKNGEEGPSGV